MAEILRKDHIFQQRDLLISKQLSELSIDLIEFEKLFASYAKIDIDTKFVSQYPQKHSNENPKHQGNYEAYRMIIDFIKDDKIKVRLRQYGVELLTASENRYLNVTQRVPISSTTMFEKDIVNYVSAFLGLSEYLREFVSLTSKNYQGLTLTEKDPAKRNKEYFEKVKVPKKNGICSIRLGSFYFHVIGKNHYVLTAIHQERVISHLRALAFMLLDMSTMKDLSEIKDFLSEFYDEVWGIVKTDPNLVGEIVKNARAIFLSSLADTSYDNKTMEQHLIEAIDAENRDASISMLSPVKRFFNGDPQPTLNTLSFYKLMLHPDYDLNEAFDGLDGLKHPNKVKPGFDISFRAHLNKSIFESLVKSGLDPRLEPIDPSAEQFTRHLVELSSRPTSSIKEMMSVQNSIWASVRIMKVRGIRKPSDQTLEPSDKSSFYGPHEDYKTMSERSPTLSHQEYYNRNDIVSELTGNSKPSMKESIHKFEQLIVLHEKFENGREPEDIDQSEYERFCQDNAESFYLVNTEPKLGEKHKRVTRLFYIPEPNLKNITQSTELLAKQISGKQTGVSITKPSRMRRSDLEKIAFSNLGADATGVPWYISFDLSKFSRKFPMRLLRIYGEMLASITGEEWMRRIDLVFRSSIVFHKSRGVFRHMLGIKGGFEGFFNFVWTSIHAIVMEMALEDSGYKGLLLVYSDDGLLMIYGNKSDPEATIPQAVKQFQRVYDAMGFTFHLGKTIISRRVWEYLGQIGYDGEIFNTYYKEMASLFEEEKKKRLRTTSEYHSAIVGRCRSLVMSGTPIRIAYMYMMVSIYSWLFAKFPKIKHDSFEAMITVPINVGGMRVPSPEEVSSVTAVDVFGSFLSDLEILRETNEPVYKSICGALYNNACLSEEPQKDIVMGRYFKTTIPTISDFGVKRKLMDMIISKSGFNKGLDEPILVSDHILAHKIFLSMHPLDPTLISEMANNLPAQILYTKSISIVRTSAALQIVDISHIKRAQAKDTKKVNRCASFWARDHALYASNMSPTELFASLTKISYPVYDIRLPKCNMTGLISRCKLLPKTNTKIYCAVSSMKGKVLRLRNYPALIEKYPEGSNKISWRSHSGDSPSARAKAMFYGIFARLANSLTYPCMMGLCKIFSVEPPRTIEPMVTSIQRRTNITGYRHDVRYQYPSFIPSVTSFSIPTIITSVMFGGTGYDRTTFTEALRWMIYCGMDEALDTQSSTFSLSVDITYKIDSKEFLTNYQNIFMDSDFPLEPIPPSYKADLLEQDLYDSLESLNFYLDDKATVTSIDQTREVVDVESSEILRGSLSEDLTNSLRLALSEREGSTVLNRFPLPEMLTKQDIRFVMFKTATTMIGAPTLAMIRSQVMAGDDFILNDYSKQALKLMDNVRRIHSCLLKFGSYPFSEEYAEKLISNKRRISKLLITIFERDSILSMYTKPIIVIKSVSAKQTKMIKEYAEAFSTCFHATRRHILDISYRSKWNHAITKKILKLSTKTSIDQLLDCLAIAEFCVRKSPHRGLYHPYNNKTFKILMAKYYLIMDYCAKKGISLRGQELDSQFQKELKSRMEEGGVSLGPDHLSHIKSRLPKSIADRGDSVLKAYTEKKLDYNDKNEYPGGSLSQVMQYVMRSQTWFKELVISPILRSIRVIHPKAVTASAYAQIGRPMENILIKPVDKHYIPYSIHYKDPVESRKIITSLDTDLISRTLSVIHKKNILRHDKLNSSEQFMRLVSEPGDKKHFPLKLAKGADHEVTISSYVRSTSCYLDEYSFYPREGKYMLGYMVGPLEDLAIMQLAIIQACDGETMLFSELPIDPSIKEEWDLSGYKPMNYDYSGIIFYSFVWERTTSNVQGYTPDDNWANSPPSLPEGWMDTILDLTFEGAIRKAEREVSRSIMKWSTKDVFEYNGVGITYRVIRKTKTMIRRPSMLFFSHIATVSQDDTDSCIYAYVALIMHLCNDGMPSQDLMGRVLNAVLSYIQKTYTNSSALQMLLKDIRNVAGWVASQSLEDTDSTQTLRYRHFTTAPKIGIRNLNLRHGLYDESWKTYSEVDAMEGTIDVREIMKLLGKLSETFLEKPMFEEGQTIYIPADITSNYLGQLFPEIEGKK